jgi:hypothetical protein
MLLWLRPRQQARCGSHSFSPPKVAAPPRPCPCRHPRARSWLQDSFGGSYARKHAAQAAAAAAKGANETQAMPMSLKILAGGIAGGRATAEGALGGQRPGQIEAGA